MSNERIEEEEGSGEVADQGKGGRVAYRNMEDHNSAGNRKVVVRGERWSSEKSSVGIRVDRSCDWDLERVRCILRVNRDLKNLEMNQWSQERRNVCHQKDLRFGYPQRRRRGCLDVHPGWTRQRRGKMEERWLCHLTQIHWSCSPVMPAPNSRVWG